MISPAKCLWVRVSISAFHFIQPRDATSRNRNLLRELPTPLLPLFHALLVAVCRRPAFDDVSIPLLALVIKLDGEIGQVGHHGAPETTGASGEVDELLVLRPLGFGGEDRFLNEVTELGGGYWG